MPCKGHTHIVCLSQQCITLPCVVPQVEPIVAEVREQGDAAVRRYTAKFDRVELDSVCVPIEVSC